MDTAVMTAVESLDYRVTVGDVAAKAGLNLEVAQQGLIALAADTQAHLQVSEAGEIAYEFPNNFRTILRNRYWRLRLQETWQKIWRVLFYLIRISFGILLILSIVLIVAAIVALTIAANSSRDDNNRSSRSGGGGMMFIPRFWVGDMFYFFNFNDRRRRASGQRLQGAGRQEEMNFLESIFSFLFGDGDPNADLEEHRWKTIGTVIRNQGGAVAAEQIAPYLDDVGEGWAQEDEDYMLPVLTRFNGIPEVSPQGHIIYHFPELQVTAQNRTRTSVASYLKATSWKFSQASGNQMGIAIGLGIFNCVGAIVLGVMLADNGSLVAELGGLVAFVYSIYGLLLAYGLAFLGIPAVRYFWVQRQNGKITAQNELRQERASTLNRLEGAVTEKIEYAQKFVAETVVTKDDLAYTTETDLTDQESEQSEKLDAQWRDRLNASES
jgi:cytochrome c biogenesis protein CcdA